VLRKFKPSDLNARVVLGNEVMQIQPSTSKTVKQFTSDGPNEFKLQILSSKEVDSVLFDIKHDSLNFTSVEQFQSKEDQLLILKAVTKPQMLSQLLKQ
jgi:hypothetical protein